MEYKYSEELRKKMWEELTNCECKLQYLKGIVQNEMELTEKDWYDWVVIKEELFKKLNEVQHRLKMQA